MTDAKYFATTKKGELFELKAELNSTEKDVKKDAIKRVIANMTVGKDVSQLFPDVINCGQTDDLELKKLVYLYSMNYAKSQPDLALMAVNTFIKDSADSNPLIRALAVRTMGCIRVDRITDYFSDPLRRCLKDDDPYVRKTAAVSVAKLYDINGALVREQGFIEQLKDLLSDSNPMVVSNAVAAIAEIRELDPSMASSLAFSHGTINKLLTALNECTEWGQIFILDAVALYNPRDDRDAQSIIERVTPRLAHANAGVVLSAIKVIMTFLDLVDQNSEVVGGVVRKLSAPLVTLLSAEPEIQYVALRNISLIIQKRPDILKHELKVFFIKYNDPIYVKLEKLDIMIRLTNQSNIAQTLAELKEYATEVDVEFVRRAVRAIGKCALKVDVAAERCVSTLLDLIQTKVNYIVQEAIIVIKDIFRKYPHKYESVIGNLCECLDTLDEPEAKASMIWIIGEYCSRIENAAELLETFLDSLHDENHQVQLQILTSIVKLFLTKPNDTQELVSQVLHLSTEDSDNPDLRDRGYIYWRLLSTSPQAAKDVILADKPLISEETNCIEPALLNELIAEISTLASIYHKPPSAFLDGGSYQAIKTLRAAGSSSELTSSNDFGDDSTPTTTKPQPSASAGGDLLIDDLLNLSMPSDVSAVQTPAAGGGMSSGSSDLLSADLNDLLGGPIGGSPQPVSSPAVVGGGLDDLLGGFGGPSVPSQSSSGSLFDSPQTSKATPTQEVWLSSQKGKGLEIRGHIVRRGGNVTMEMTLSNSAMQPLSGFAIQFNKNSFGLVPAAPLKVDSIAPNGSAQTSLRLNTSGVVQTMNPLNNLQIAVKNNAGVFYFAVLVPLHTLFIEGGQLEKKVYLNTWKEIPQHNESQFKVKGSTPYRPDAIEQKLSEHNVFTVARRTQDGQELLYQSLKMSNGLLCLIEITVMSPNTALQIALRSKAPDAHPLIQKSLEFLLSQ